MEVAIVFLCITALVSTIMLWPTKAKKAMEEKLKEEIQTAKIVGVTAGSDAKDFVNCVKCRTIIPKHHKYCTQCGACQSALERLNEACGNNKSNLEWGKGMLNGILGVVRFAFGLLAIAVGALILYSVFH
jgi:hypothetical protein